jgi:hypothetical protein
MVPIGFWHAHRHAGSAIASPIGNSSGALVIAGFFTPRARPHLSRVLFGG